MSYLVLSVVVMDPFFFIQNARVEVGGVSSSKSRMSFVFARQLVLLNSILVGLSSSCYWGCPKDKKMPWRATSSHLNLDLS